MITKTWSRWGTPVGTSPSLANMGADNMAKASPRAAAFLNISFTFLSREAGIAAAPGRRARARPAVLWNLSIAGGLQQCENLVNTTSNDIAGFRVCGSFQIAR